MNNLLKRIFRTVLCTAISFFVWFCLSKTFAATDTMDTTFENMSLDTWLKVTDYLYDNIEDANIKAKLQPLTTNGSKSTAIYSSVMNTIDNYEELTSSSSILNYIRYARSELSSLIFIVTNDSRLHIFTNELWKFNGGTSTDLTNYEYVEPATFDMSISVSSYNGNGGGAILKYHGASSSTDVHTGNYYHLYIDLNSNYSISGSNGNYSNLGVTIPISKYNLVQEDDYNIAAFSYGSEQDNTMIVQIAGSGSLGNPLITYYMPYYASNNSTVLPYLCSNAVYLDGSENTGGSTGGNTGPDTGGGGGSDSGGGTTDVDLGKIEEELGNINTGINSPDSTINNNLDDIENSINDLNNNITTVPDLSEKEEITGDDIIDNLGFEVTVDPYDNFWNTLISELQSVLTTNNNRTITLEFRGEIYTISVDDFNFNSMPLILKNFLQLLTVSIMTYFLVCWIKKSVDLIASGDMSEVLAMNEEEGIVDLF